MRALEERHNQLFPPRALIVFSSDPLIEAQRKGLGKSAAETRAIYRALLRHLLETAHTARQQLPFELVIVSDASDAGNIRKAFKQLPDAPGYTFLPHKGSHFAEKFSHALNATLAMGFQEVVIIGNDCPDLSAALLSESFRQLDTHDIVLGPARDGGFYLLGLRQFDESLLSGIRWCSGAVRAQLIGNIARLGLSLHLLPQQRDIDARSDLHNWLCSATAVQSLWLLNTLQWMLRIRCFTCFYLPPFLSKTNARKRIWQKPPPGVMQHS